ncbi:putative transposase (plasmid) [Calothrix sp. NIES-4101]|nr:putative transposase [Calothrix sp. NIES-4101]
MRDELEAETISIWFKIKLNHPMNLQRQKRHSNFWIGLYGFNWIVAWHECQAWVEELVASIRTQ